VVGDVICSCSREPGDLLTCGEEQLLADDFDEKLNSSCLDFAYEEFDQLVEKYLSEWIRVERG